MVRPRTRRIGIDGLMTTNHAVQSANPDTSLRRYNAHFTTTVTRALRIVPVRSLTEAVTMCTPVLSTL